MQCPEGKRRPGHPDLQVQALQCLRRKKHVHAAEIRFFPGILFKEHVLPLPEQFQNQLAAFHNDSFQEGVRNHRTAHQ